MTGLRDRKKREVRHRVIQAAGALFGDKGLDDTTMEEIAAAADVSVATVYNYFGSKPNLLLAGVEDDTNEMLELGNAVLAKPGADPRRAVKRLFSIYFEHLLTWDRALLREVVSASLRPGAADLTAELAQMDVRLMEQTGALLSHFAATGRLRSGTSAEDASLLLFSVLATHLMMLISIEDLPAAALKRQVNQQIDLAFAGLSVNSKKAK